MATLTVMPASQTYRILVVDDLLDNLLLLQTLLEAEGYAVEIAQSGAGALAAIAASPPDLVLLDVMMPGMNGYEVTQRVRADHPASEIPILLVTAHDEPNAVEGLGVGADDFIRKPLDLEELLARVRASLRLKHRVQDG